MFKGFVRTKIFKISDKTIPFSWRMFLEKSGKIAKYQVQCKFEPPIKYPGSAPEI